MQTVAEAANEAAASSTTGGGGFLEFVKTYGANVLVTAVIVAIVVYAVIFLRNRFPIVREFMVFLRERKLWWMSPIVVIFILLALLIVTMEGSAIAPFIYALF